MPYEEFLSILASNSDLEADRVLLLELYKEVGKAVGRVWKRPEDDPVRKVVVSVARSLLEGLTDATARANTVREELLISASDWSTFFPAEVGE